VNIFPDSSVLLAACGSARKSSASPAIESA